MRSKYSEYPEYHTSLDDLNLVTPSGLFGGFEVLQKCLECLEKNEKLEVAVFCEPQLGKRGLYPTLSTLDTKAQVTNIKNLIAYCDGTLSLLEIARKINVPMWDLYSLVEQLKENELLVKVSKLH